jgi:multisubunit Na+/H+ antiporter MnhF subunit
MNEWLWAAAVLAAAPAVLLIVAVRNSILDAMVALEVAAADATLALLLVAEGTGRQGFADLALVFGVLSYVGAIAFLRFVERVR